MNRSVSISGLRKLVLLALALSVGISGAAVAKPAQKTSGVIYASANHAEGSDGYVSGDLKDTLLGRGAIVYVINAAAGPKPGSILIKAKRITIYTKKGSLSGTGQGTQTGDKITDGSFNLKKGTAGYKGHSMKGTFSGTFSEGVYKFKYKAKFK